MGDTHEENGDGCDLMCSTADKLFLINGFPTGHLSPFALSPKSNLALCMSVNINKPSNLALKYHLLCRTQCHSRGTRVDAGHCCSLCLK